MDREFRADEIRFFQHLFHLTSIRISTISDTFNLCSLAYDTFYKWPPFDPPLYLGMNIAGTR
jgi:hypothetical protein